VIKDIFYVGETIHCMIELRDLDEDLQSPTTSMKVTIVSQQGSTVVDAQDMTEDDTGQYYYDYTSTGAVAGVYKITYTATDGTLVSKARDYFTLKQ
jgi:uncharacterized protein YfaS (alpha-2-macroglobulin family)